MTGPGRASRAVRLAVLGAILVLVASAAVLLATRPSKLAWPPPGTKARCYKPLSQPKSKGAPVYFECKCGEDDCTFMQLEK
jgi:hypothetical protein